MTDELKPCPMCGGEAAVNSVLYGTDSDEALLNGQRKFFGVNCIRCGLNNRGLIGYKTPEEAIAAWNRRTREATHEERIAAVTWNQRCEEHLDHQTGMVTHAMIQQRMQEEIDELRSILARADEGENNGNE